MGLIKRLFSFIPFNKALIAAVLACAGLGWLLLQQHEENGKLQSQLAQWQAANDAWAESWQARETEYKAAQARMKRRDDNYRKIQGDLNEYRKRLQAINSQNDGSDCRIGNDAWLLIRESAKDPTGTAYRAASGESGAATDNADP